jgi:hypothetical protein
MRRHLSHRKLELAFSVSYYVGSVSCYIGDHSAAQLKRIRRAHLAKCHAGYSAILPEKPKKRRQTDEFMVKQAKLFPYHGVRFNG